MPARRSSMKIVADENIAALDRFFEGLGELRVMPGRAITARALKGADALLVRSVTQVDGSLLRDSRVSFVGSATSGIDHVDTDYLSSRGIVFHHAAGANANAVVEYVLSALAALHVQRNINWVEASVGIVGAGNIGGALARRLAALNVPYLIHDPYLSKTGEHGAQLTTFERACARDIVTIHTPLTRTCEHPTRHLFDQDVLEAMGGGQVLINAARGAVVDNAALERRLRRGTGLHTVLDVWENEPAIDLALLGHITIATPHIAGYSLEGKLRSTVTLYRALCRHFHLEQEEHNAEEPVLTIDLGRMEEQEESRALDHCLLAAYNILADHHAMQSLRRDISPAQRFDMLRKHYRARHEFSSYRVLHAPAAVADRLAALGFRVGSGA